MPYIGNASANRFVASKAATQFSGDGSTTAFTLDHSVGADEDILVSVDGVIQEPSVAYAVSGTTLTFTAAPSSNSGNNIFVYYLFRTVATVDHPSTSALSATSGTFSTSLDVTNNLGVGVSPTTSYGRVTQIHDTGTSGANLRLTDSTSGSGTGNGFEIIQIGVNNYMINRETGFISLYTSNAEALKIDSAGHVTKPKQPAFLVKPASNQTNLTVGAFTTVVFGTEIFDQNSDFASNVFTAPVTGRYQFNVEILLQAVNNAYEYIDVQLITSNRNYINDMTPDHFMNTDSTLHMGINVLADMDAGDTAYVRIAVPNAGSAQTDVHTYSSFSGYLVA